MKRKKLTYRFHNSNEDRVLTDKLLEVIIEANTERVRQAVENEILKRQMETNDLNNTKSA